MYVVQAKTLEACINENKYYLSEKAKRDVGWQEAENHFLNTYFNGFTAGFRASFCGLVCPHRKNCLQARNYIS